MLKALRRIGKEISASQDLERVFSIVLEHVKSSVEAEACSIFLVDEEKAEYVLAATEGLNPKWVGKTRFKFGESLVSLVGEREEPVNVEDAPSHPRFCPYSKSKAERERFRAFLGVPVMHQRKVLGVLVVEQAVVRQFDDAEVAFMATLAAQLAGAIAEGKASGVYEELGSRGGRRSFKGKVYLGVVGVAGVAIGQVVVVYPPADLDAVPEREAKNVKAELLAFDEAIEATKVQIKQLGEMIAERLPAEEQSLFEVYLGILGGKHLSNEIKKVIRDGMWAQGAVKRVIIDHMRKFEAMEDPYLAERGTDLKDLGQRILFHLQSGQKKMTQYPERAILVGEDVSPAQLAEVPQSQLAGVVSGKGSGGSHLAVLARAMGVPTVMGVSGLPISQLEGEEVIIDGYYGQVYVAPVASVRKEFKALFKEEQELDAKLQELRDLPAETLDGHSTSLFVNTGLVADVGRALSVGAEGVGLYRTEVPFMIRDRFPSEEEQRVIYRQLLSAFAPRPVMMRTLDVGGDKPLPYFPVEEDNPFLGWRGIRITLDHPDIFLVQLRAMIRASVDLDNLYVMLPMVGNVSEVEAALKLLTQAHVELVEEGLDVKMPGLGVMIEVPAAVYQVRELAKRVDFLSVGTNDLTQYLLAVDRNNALVSGLYDALHPAVLQALLQVVKGAHKERRSVSVCGELAGDPVAVVLLLAMGFDTLSISASSLPRVKWVVRNFTMTHAKQLLEEVLAMDDPVEIRCHMELAIEEAGLAGLIRAGK